MKGSAKFISLMLCSAMLLLPMLSSCGGDPADNGSDTSQTEAESESLTDSTEVTYPSQLYADKKMNYRIVYAAGDGGDTKAAAEALYNKLVNYISDKSFLVADTNSTPGDMPEILIGKTNRAESSQILSTLEEKTYTIKKINGQIVIIADVEWMITDAIEIFMEKIEFSKDRKTAELSKDLEGTYTHDGTSRSRWTIDLPAYDGGILSQNSYSSNYGLNSMGGAHPRDYKVICATSTNAEEFSAYADKLTAAGCTLEQVSNGSIISYWVTKGETRMYMYLSKNVGEARFVLDKDGTATEEDFSYVYEKKTGDTTVLYQYGFMMSDHGKNIDEYYKDANGNKILNKETSNCGQLLIFKLADNSLMIIDGASHYMMPEKAMKGLNDFLHEITGTPIGEKVTISNWLITHAHLDHFGGMARFLVNYHEYYEIERACFNFNYKDSNMPEFFDNYLKVWYPNILYYRPHTGETLKIADVTIDVLYTYEDSISAESGAIILDRMPLLWGGNSAIDQNNSSITARITFDGKTFILTGDIAMVAMDTLIANYSAAELKADILQVSHHGLNPIDELYALISPSVSLYSQKKEAAPILNSLSIKAYESVINHTEGGLNNIYFAGNCTAGISVNANGSFTVSTREVIGDIWDKQGVFYVTGK